MASGNKAEAIAEHIRERIRTQEWVPGGFLPSERKLAEDLGVARNTLRAALQALEEEGAILRNGRHGCTILGRPSPMGSGLVLVAFSGVNGVLGTISPECMANLGAVLCTCGRADMRLQLVVVARDEVDRLRDEVKAKRAVGVLLMADQRPDLTDALRKDGTPVLCGQPGIRRPRAFGGRGLLGYRPPCGGALSGVGPPQAGHFGRSPGS